MTVILQICVKPELPDAFLLSDICLLLAIEPWEINPKFDFAAGSYIKFTLDDKDRSEKNRLPR